MSRRALGKGLGALIPTSADVDLRDGQEETLREVPGVSMRDIPIDEIRPIDVKHLKADRAAAAEAKRGTTTVAPTR